MLDFAYRTGLSPLGTESSRYLWTDAFAVCNFLGLYHETKNQDFKELALKLVNQVHFVLGKYRNDDTRSGWLSSERHPTLKGLRIGKPILERREDEKYDPIKEWERDGQYFHYLTKWTHALLQTGKVTEEEKYIKWSRDLAEASLRFIKGKRMYWKLSTDLNYPLVSSMGQHDPIDGYVTFTTLQPFNSSVVDQGISQFNSIMEKIIPVTTDPLGLGGLLFDIYRLNQMGHEIEFQSRLINAVKRGLESITINHQLAFRELGLSIGLAGAKKMNILKNYWYIIDEINGHWVNHWDGSEHKNINQVMLATSLSPQGFLEL